MLPGLDSASMCAAVASMKTCISAPRYAASTSGSSAAASASACSTAPCWANTATTPAVASRMTAGPEPWAVYQTSAIAELSAPSRSTTFSTR